MLKPHFLLVFFAFVSMLFSSAEASPYEVNEVSVLTVESAITPATVDYLRFQLPRIPDRSLVLLKLNTPGGLITSTKEIISLLSERKLPLVIWVTPSGASAASAGAIIAATAHFILMSPGSNLGAATPVGLGGDIDQKDSKAKALNDLSALVRSFSELRKRPYKPFEAMITDAKSFTDKEALADGIITGIASESKDLAPLLEGKEFSLNGDVSTLRFSPKTAFVEYAPTLGQKLLSVLADPSLAYFLFLLGIGLIYFELQAPGGYVAGGVGCGLVLLAGIAFQVLPLNWGAFGLILVGAVLLILELHITSYGLLGIGGLASLMIGSLFLFHGETGFISVEHTILVSTLLGIVSAIGLLVWYLWREDRKKVMIRDFFIPLGSLGVVMSTSDAQGVYQIKVKGEIWRAISTESLAIGETVSVIEVDNQNLTAKVKKHT